MKKFNRDKLIAEQLIREHVRKRIRKQISSKNIMEEKLRTAVRRILEA